MGSPSLFTRQRALKMGYFYWLRVKNSNHLHTELSLGYPKDTKFYIESKASFTDISSIASFKLFLIASLREYCTFSDSSVVSLKSQHGQNTPTQELFSKKRSCSTIRLLLDCSQQIPDKKIGGHRARLREKENLFRYRAQFEGNLLRVLMCAR